MRSSVVHLTSRACIIDVAQSSSENAHALEVEPQSPLVFKHDSLYSPVKAIFLFVLSILLTGLERDNSHQLQCIWSKGNACAVLFGVESRKYLLCI